MKFGRNWGRLGMKSDFITKPLSQLASIQTGPFGSQLHKKDYVKHGTPIVTVEHLGQKCFTEQNLPCVSNEDKMRLNKYILRKGDIVFSRVGAVDRCSFVCKKYDGWMFSGRCLRVRPSSEIEPEYLYYFFNLAATKQFIRGIATGATMPSINTKFMGEVPITYPNINIQRKIVAVLNLLDDKIQINTEINKNLQAQAQAIYTKKFITDADSSWPEGKLSDLIEVCYGKDHKKLNDGDIPVYGSGGIMRHADQSLYDQESVLVPRKGTLNNVMYVNEPFWSVDTTFFTKMKRPNVAKFVFHFLKGKDLASMNAGSAVPSMTTKILDAIPLQIPDNQTLSNFEAQVSPYYEAMAESENLAALRDALLPKLMSGEIDVSAINL